MNQPLTPSYIEPILQKAQTAPLSDALLAHLGETIEALLKNVDNRIYRALLEGPLDEDAAVQAWMEKAAYVRLRNQLIMQSRVGHNSAKRVEHLLTQGAPNGR